MNYRIGQTVILDNDQHVRITEVNETNRTYKGRDEDTDEEITFSESRILVSY